MLYLSFQPDESLWNKTFLITAGVLAFGGILFSVFVDDKELTWAKPRFNTHSNSIENEDEPLVT